MVVAVAVAAELVAAAEVVVAEEVVVACVQFSCGGQWPALFFVAIYLVLFCFLSLA